MLRYSGNDVYLHETSNYAWPERLSLFWKYQEILISWNQRDI